MSRFDAVLFDAGDTLIRLRGNGLQLLHRAAGGLGGARLNPEQAAQVWHRVLARSSTAEELAKGRDLSSQRHREAWTGLYRAAGCEQLAPGLSEQFYAITLQPDSWEAFPDARPTLHSLRNSGLRLGVLSDSGIDLRPVLDRSGLSEYLDAVLMSFELGVCKPAAKAFLAACDGLGVAPERTLMVGDNPLTDSRAVEVGMHVFLLPAAPRSGPRGLDQVLSLV